MSIPAGSSSELPPMAELFSLKELSDRHPNLLPLNRVRWAARNRHRNGLTYTGALFESPCGEIIAHEPRFLRWLLGLSGRAKPRACKKQSAKSYASLERR
jgi:hypothetical protein